MIKGIVRRLSYMVLAGSVIGLTGCMHKGAVADRSRGADDSLEFVDAEGILNTSRMTPDQVVEIANEAAKAKGYVLDKYLNPKIEFSPQHKGREWMVFFERNFTAPPGAHFLVWIDDETGEALLMSGE